jgi:hypothetical protein
VHEQSLGGLVDLGSAEFCTVTAVIADMPCTRQARKVLRSAWMPAPPPESEPAIVRAVGGEAVIEMESSQA